MYKPVYKIPNSLDRSILDHEIPLTKGVNVRPIPLKVVLFWLGSVMALFWIVSSTPVKQADVGLIVLFCLWWIAATAFFGQYSKTKELKFMGLPALLNYLPGTARRVMTRSTSAPAAFASIAGVSGIEEDGLVRFSDGTLGRGYLVVGSASVLVFEADKQAIVNRVDAFYHKVETGVEYIWVTTKEPQRVFRQLAALERRNRALAVREPELFALLDEQRSILVDSVGSKLNSIHQYLVIKAENEESLRRAHNLLQAEVEDSSLMIKGCTILDGEDFAEMARVLFTSGD